MRSVDTESHSVPTPGSPNTGESTEPLLPRNRKPKKHKPLLPRFAEVEKLPRWAAVAFAARCARRVLPVFQQMLPAEASDKAKIVEDAVIAVELCAATASEAISDNVYSSAVAALDFFASRNDADAANVSANAIFAALDSAKVGKAATLATCAADDATRVILLTSSHPQNLLVIRRDFERLRKLAKKHNWTDQTPVPPEMFGAMWPKTRAPKWAKETHKPRG
ncbi:MAG: hypothetical protein L0241_26805 [Planctomycetia bacterium]|nr:hypothetical protein [Planctomycetia bacterium]